jgi:hypothetical protein
MRPACKDKIKQTNGNQPKTHTGCHSMNQLLLDWPDPRHQLTLQFFRKFFPTNHRKLRVKNVGLAGQKQSMYV